MTTLLSASGSFDDNGCTLDSVDNTANNIIDEEKANDTIISQVIEEGNDGDASVDMTPSLSAAQTQDINTNDEEETFSHSTNNENTPPQPIIPTTPNSKRHNLYKISIIIFAISILCIIIGVSVKVSNDKSSSNEEVAKDTNLITTEETSSTTLLRSTNAPSPITPSFETYAGSTVLVSNEEILESTTNEDEELKQISNTPSISSQPSNAPTSSSSIGADITSWINAFNSLTDTNDKEEILAAIQDEMEEGGDETVGELPASTLATANETIVNTTTTTTSTSSTTTTTTTTTLEPSKPPSTLPTTQSLTTLQPSSRHYPQMFDV